METPRNDAAALAERLQALYVDELRQSLAPQVHRTLEWRQMEALIQRARSCAPAAYTEPDATTWIWSDLHLGHEHSRTVFERPFPTAAAADEAMMDAWYEEVADGRDHHLPWRHHRRRRGPAPPPGMVAEGAGHEVARARQSRRRPGEPNPAVRDRSHGGDAVRGGRAAAAADARAAAAGAARRGQRPRARPRCRSRRRRTGTSTSASNI